MLAVSPLRLAVFIVSLHISVSVSDSCTYVSNREMVLWTIYNNDYGRKSGNVLSVLKTLSWHGGTSVVHNEVGVSVARGTRYTERT